MKKNMLFVVALLAMMFVACEKEDDNPAYVGLWETAEYNAMIPAENGYMEVKQRIEFDFETDNFEALVYNNVSNVWVNAMGVRGSIESEADSVMNAELNEVGLLGGSSLTWYSKDVAEEEALFNQYIQLVSATIPTAFEATYKVDGDKMDLIIPAAQDTIHLYKK